MTALWLLRLLAALLVVPTLVAVGAPLSPEQEAAAPGDLPRSRSSSISSDSSANLLTDDLSDLPVRDLPTVPDMGPTTAVIGFAPDAIRRVQRTPEGTPSNEMVGKAKGRLSSLENAIMSSGALTREPAAVPHRPSGNAQENSFQQTAMGKNHEPPSTSPPYEVVQSLLVVPRFGAPRGVEPFTGIHEKPPSRARGPGSSEAAPSAPSAPVAWTAKGRTGPSDPAPSNSGKGCVAQKLSKVMNNAKDVLSLWKRRSKVRRAALFDAEAAVATPGTP
ncbi:hypothetical protein CXG81DRAFT_20781 [Caulochytrium protostelioides]|uniref:Uncharacterized protein n=1 Tax=Caulochytrium protostelioides TaxID=1555241 RepID=A0A4P9X245_9FUNG|nr:hypothetical protein CXG81DRAFT_20781 [Caulochytrium protostelioides]|eukprot:RKO99088.1 hypothetical protein CXG81DRAFT_20781 [Caulochytrium protostelioides]